MCVLDFVAGFFHAIEIRGKELHIVARNHFHQRWQHGGFRVPDLPQRAIQQNDFLLASAGVTEFEARSRHGWRLVRRDNFCCRRRATRTLFRVYL